MSIRLHLFSARCLGWLLLLALPLPALGALDNTAISLGWNYQQKGLSEWRIMDVSGASVLTEAAVDLKNSTQEVAHMVAFMNETKTHNFLFSYTPLEQYDTDSGTVLDAIDYTLIIGYKTSRGDATTTLPEGRESDAIPIYFNREQSGSQVCTFYVRVGDSSAACAGTYVSTVQITESAT